MIDYRGAVIYTKIEKNKGGSKVYRAEYSFQTHGYDRSPGFNATSKRAAVQRAMDAIDDSLNVVELSNRFLLRKSA